MEKKKLIRKQVQEVTRREVKKSIRKKIQKKEINL